jgi:hypothetical protein
MVPVGIEQCDVLRLERLDLAVVGQPLVTDALAGTWN